MIFRSNNSVCEASRTSKLKDVSWNFKKYIINFFCSFSFADIGTETVDDYVVCSLKITCIFYLTYLQKQTVRGLKECCQNDTDVLDTIESQSLSDTNMWGD